MEQYYTLQEVMARLNISRDTIMGLIRKGKIPGTIKLSNAETASRTGTRPVWKRIQHRFVPSKQPSYSGRICGNGRSRKAKQSRKYVA